MDNMLQKYMKLGKAPHLAQYVAVVLLLLKSTLYLPLQSKVVLYSAC